MPPPPTTRPTEQELAQLRRQIADGRPPVNEVPGVVTLELVLARNNTVAVTVPYLLVYSTGWVLPVTVMTARRPADNFGLLLSGMAHPMLRTTERTPLLLGVQYADGRRGSTAHEGVRPEQGQLDAGAGRLSMQSTPGGAQEGSAVSVAASWFIRPVPDDGDVTLIAAWPKFDVDEDRAVISGGQLRAALGRVNVLWPEPPDPMEYPSSRTIPPVQFPESGWFSVIPPAAETDEGPESDVGRA